MRFAGPVLAFVMLLQLVWPTAAFADRAESEQWVEEAIEYYRDNDLWLSIAKSDGAIAKDRTNPRGWMWLGIACYVNDGDGVVIGGCAWSAKTPYEALVKAEQLAGGRLPHPLGRAILAYLRGKQYWGLAQYGRAMAQFKTAIQNRPDLTEAYFDLAKLQEERGQAGAAASTYRLFVQRFPDSPDAPKAKANADRLGEIAARQEATRRQAAEEARQAKLQREAEARQAAQARIDAERQRRAEADRQKREAVERVKREAEARARRQRQIALARQGLWFLPLLGIMAAGLVVWRRVYRPRLNAEVVDVMGEDADTGKIKVEIPKVFDEGRIRTDLAKYSKSDTALKTYISGIFARFGMEQDRKVMLKLIEHLGVRKELYAAALSAKRAYEDLGRADLESQVATMELELKRKRLLRETQQVDTVEAKRTELEIARLEREIEDLKRPPSVPQKKPARRKRPSEVSAEFAEEVTKIRHAEKAIREAVQDEARATELVADLWEDFRQRWPDYGDAIAEAREDYEGDEE